MARLDISGYGQLETNNVAFRRDGRIEAQLKPNLTDFEGKVLENGMILAIDAAAREVKLPVNNELPLAIHYSAEHLHDERAMGLKDFKILPEEDVYPRMGYLSVGDKFTTNTISFGTGVADLDAITDEEVVYGTTSADGSIELVSAFPEGLALRVLDKTVMPDGQPALKFQVLSVPSVSVSGAGGQK